MASIQLLTDLDAFYLEHRCCGELNADVEKAEAGNHRIWMTCTCGGRIEREVAAYYEPNP